MRWLGGLLAILAGTAAAQPTNGGTQPYRRSQSSSGEICLYLRNRQFVYTVDAAGSQKTPGDAEFAAIDASFNTWQAVSELCSDVSFRSAPRAVDPPVGYDQQNPDANANVITFREVACADVVSPGDDCEFEGSCANKYRCWEHGDFTIGLTTTTYSSRTGAIFDADIELNAAPHADGSPAFLFTAVNSPPCPADAPASNCVATDIQNTMTHEIGHVIGLDHAEVPGSTMEASAQMGETKKRILDSGTAQGFCDVYPRAQPAASCEATNLLRKRVVATNRGTGCTASAGSAGPGTLLPLLLPVLALRSRRRRPAGRAADGAGPLA